MAIIESFVIPLTEVGNQDIIASLNRLGSVSLEPVADLKGKPTKFIGTLVTSTSVKFGILFYNWKRALGVNKIMQAVRIAQNVGMPGVFVISNEYSSAAVEQANRINQLNSTKIILMSTDELGKLPE